jgi:hypothetical protein
VGYFRANYGRRAEFQLKTWIVKTAKGLVVNKSSIGEESRPHLEKFLETSKKLAAKKAVAFSGATQSGSSISFPFLPGESLEESLVKAFLLDKEGSVNKLLDSYDAALERLSSPGMVAKGAETVLGPLITEFSHGPLVDPGIIDLNLDNFIMHNESASLIDYEWVVNTGLPLNYLRTRAYMWLGIRFYETFELLSNRLKTVKLTSSCMLPRVIVERYAFTSNDIELCQQIEFGHFQPWVRGIEQALDAPLPSDTVFALDKLDAAERQLASLEQELDQAAQTAEIRSTELAALRRSKTYRLGRLMTSPLRLLRRR